MAERLSRVEKQEKKEPKAHPMQLKYEFDRKSRKYTERYIRAKKASSADSCSQGLKAACDTNPWLDWQSMMSQRHGLSLVLCSISTPLAGCMQSGLMGKGPAPAGQQRCADRVPEGTGKALCCQAAADGRGTPAEVPEAPEPERQEADQG